MINLRNIYQNYVQGKISVNVLDNLDLNIREGENIAIIGPSGSGKSTLLNIIGLLENPSSGKVVISSKDCNLLGSEDRVIFRKNKIGFIFQNNQLLEDFSVEENVAMPLILDGNSYFKSIEKANEFLELLGIIDRRRFKPALLSGGEQQRVAIARAVIKNPSILLADEPTGSLDKQNSYAVFDFIKTLSNERKLTTVIATHNINLIKKLDKCYTIEKGKLLDFKNK